MYTLFKEPAPAGSFSFADRDSLSRPGRGLWFAGLPGRAFSGSSHRKPAPKAASRPRIGRNTPGGISRPRLQRLMPMRRPRAAAPGQVRGERHGSKCRKNSPSPVKPASPACRTGSRPTRRPDGFWGKARLRRVSLRAENRDGRPGCTARTGKLRQNRTARRPGSAQTGRGREQPDVHPLKY